MDFIAKEVPISQDLFFGEPILTQQCFLALILLALKFQHRISLALRKHYDMVELALGCSPWYFELVPIEFDLVQL